MLADGAACRGVPGAGTRWREANQGVILIRITERCGLVAAVILCAVLIALTLALTVRTADARWPRLAGKASVFGNDWTQGVHDPSDSGTTALGTPTSRGGIAVYRYSTLGGWWWVCAPRQILARGVARCHLVRQTDIGPAPFTGRVLDVTATTSRRAWRLRVRGWPTDVGRWTLKYRGG